MMLFVLGILLGIFICMMIPPRELIRKVIFLFLKTSEHISQKVAEMAEAEKQDK